MTSDIIILIASVFAGVFMFILEGTMEDKHILSTLFFCVSIVALLGILQII